MNTLHKSRKPSEIYIFTELGKEKVCIHCGEHFPATKEFFYGRGGVDKNGEPFLEANCKACYKERFKPWITGTCDVAYRYNNS